MYNRITFLYIQNEHSNVNQLYSNIVEVDNKLYCSTNKASGGDGIPAELFQLLKDDAVKGLHSTDWFQIGKGIHQGCLLSPCSFNLYAEYIMRNAGLEEAQAGIKISGRNSNNLRYADNTILMAESEELKRLLMKVKEENEKVDISTFQKTEIMSSGPITSWQIDGETMETVRDFILGGSKITADGDCSNEI